MRLTLTEHDTGTSDNSPSQENVARADLARLRRTQFLLAMALSLALLSLTGCADQGVQAEDKPGARPVPVRLVTVAQQEVRRTSSQPATAHAFYRAEIHARVSGYVDAIHADIGDVVRKGALLATIDIPEMRLQRLIIESRVRRSKSREQSAAAGLELARAGIGAAEARLAQARSELKRVAASVAAAEAEFERTNDLVERQSLEPRVLDEVRMKRDSELAAVDAVRSAILSAEADVTVAGATATAASADLSAAQADTGIAEAELSELDARIEFATLTAPFDGVVTRRHVDPGDLVRSDQSSAEPLFEISQVNTLRIHIPVPEADAPHVHEGNPVFVSFPSTLGDESFEVGVTRVTGDLDPSTRTMLVEAVVDNAGGKLLPGMFGQAEIQLAVTATASVLPARAVRFRENGDAFVYLVNENETVSVVPVQTGHDDGQLIEVVAGVAAGQQVVDAHLRRLSDGQQVTRITN